MISEVAVEKKQFDNVFYMINNAILFVYVFFAVFFPADNSNIKVISLIIFFIYNIFPLLKSKLNKSQLWLIGFTTIWTIVTFGLSLITSNSEIITIIKRIYPSVILLMAVIVPINKLNFEKYFILALKIMAVVITMCAALDFLKILDLTKNPLCNYMHSSSNAMIGKGDDFSFYYLIFFKTSPLLLFLVFKSLKNKQYFWFLISSVSVILSGTRANVFTLFALFVLYILFVNGKDFNKFISIVVLFLILFVVLLPMMYDYISNIFIAKSGSDAVRDGHLKGIFEVLNNPVNLLFGTGWGSSFYSYGLGQNVSMVELAYWDILRQVGIIAFIPYIFMLLMPLFSAIKNKHYDAVCAYLGFLIITYTNPFLFSSTGYLAIVYMYIKKEQL